MPSKKLSITLVTSNKGKLREFKQILEPQITVNHIELVHPEIRSESNEDIVRQSAMEISKLLNKAVVCEDSGLFINSLNGFPGTFSAWVHKKIGLEGIMKLMQGAKDRSCVYRSAVAYCEPGKAPASFIGEEDGSIDESIRGSFGFGHDPIFIPEGSKKTYGEMSNAEEMKKFRRMAVEKLKEFLIK